MGNTVRLTVRRSAAAAEKPPSGHRPISATFGIWRARPSRTPPLHRGHSHFFRDALCPAIRSKTKSTAGH